jgi:DNA-binding protein WhiA
MPTFEDFIMNEMRSRANRRVNCDTANINKQVQTSANQISIIEKLAASGKIKSLSAKLQETAAARCEHPDATYEELAHILSITKSGLVNRLKKIISHT